MKFKPIVKWTGSKRKIAQEIITHFPKQINTYYEPFIGSGAILRTLLESDVKVGKFVCSDKNEDLIRMWLDIRDSPQFLIDSFTKYSEELANSANPEDYYYKFREDFNTNKGGHSGAKFFFLTRTCYAGVVRYNNKGIFNTPYGKSHLLKKETAAQRILDWSTKIKNVEFHWKDYKEIQPLQNDFVFLDPPYFNVKAVMYFGKINFNEFIQYITNLACSWGMTLDGKSTNYDRTCEIPTEIYDKKMYLAPQNCFLSMMINKDNTIQESFYLKIRQNELNNE